MSDAHDLALAIAFDRSLLECSSTRTERSSWGTGLFHDGFPRRLDANLLLVERSLAGEAVGALAAEADRLLVGLSHRKIRLQDDADGARLAAGLAELGYAGERDVVMVHGDSPTPRASPPCRSSRSTRSGSIWPRSAGARGGERTLKHPGLRSPGRA